MEPQYRKEREIPKMLSCNKSKHTVKRGAKREREAGFLKQISRQFKKILLTERCMQILCTNTKDEASNKQDKNGVCKA